MIVFTLYEPVPPPPCPHFTRPPPPLTLNEPSAVTTRHNEFPLLGHIPLTHSQTHFPPSLTCFPPRWGTKPDGVCVVVGTLGSGFERNTTGDVIATASDLSPRGLQVCPPLASILQ